MENQQGKAQIAAGARWLHPLFWALEVPTLGILLFAWSQFHPHLDWLIPVSLGYVRISDEFWVLFLITPLLLLLACLYGRGVLGWRTRLGTWTGLLTFAWILALSVLPR